MQFSLYHCTEGRTADYRTRAINNRGLYSGKTFWLLVCGYYSREVTIQEKLFCTAMSTTLFHRNSYKNFQKKLGFLSLDSQDLDSQDLDSQDLDPHQFIGTMKLIT